MSVRWNEGRVTIFEDALETKGVPELGNTLQFASRGSKRGSSATEVVASMLSRLTKSERNRIHGIELYRTSRISDLSIFHVLPKLSRFSIETNAVKQIEPLQKWKRFDRVSIDAYRRTYSLSALTPILIKNLSVNVYFEEDIAIINEQRGLTSLGIGGRLPKIALDNSDICGHIAFLRAKTTELCVAQPFDELWIRECPQLTELRINSVKKIWIVNKGDMDWSRLGQIDGLYDLSIERLSAESSLEWIPSCQSLKTLRIARLSNAKGNEEKFINTMLACDRLSGVKVSSGLSKATALRLSQENPSMIVSDGDNSYVDGNVLPYHEFHRRTD